MSEGCVFCVCHDRVVCENDLAFAIYDSFPVSPGHMLVIPRRHVPDYFSATGEEIIAMHGLIVRCREVLEETYRPAGYNIGVNVGRAGGQSIFHLHVHVIPRYRGDTPKPRGGVRHVIDGRGDYPG
ncbi:HIT family protein [bacterium]|nr:HIT family protein [candidate division CSSED10-310 bacterium]